MPGRVEDEAIRTDLEPVVTMDLIVAFSVAATAVQRHQPVVHEYVVINPHAAGRLNAQPFGPKGPLPRQGHRWSDALRASRVAEVVLVGHVQADPDDGLVR